MRAQPPHSPVNPWPYPAGPWERIHVDFTGPFMGSMFIVVVDAYSEWLEVICMASTTAGKTVEVLRDLFGWYGLPHTLVSDNGPQFTARAFEVGQLVLARNFREGPWWLQGGVVSKEGPVSLQGGSGWSNLGPTH